MPELIIEIYPKEGSATICTIDGLEVVDSAHADDLRDCNRSGDCQDACEYVLDNIGVEFRIIAADCRGQYENRIATAQEKQACCEEIYFESDSDFSDERLAETYLVWQAASDIDEPR